MNLVNADKSATQISMEPREAALLLEGLEAQREELGHVAEELIELLRSAGINPPPVPDHIRSEYAGPE